MSIDSLKTTDVLPVESVSMSEAPPARFTWEKLFDSASERLELMKQVRVLDREEKIITQVQNMLLAIARKEKVDFDEFKDLVASVGIEVETLEDLVPEKKDESDAGTQAPEAPIVETVSKQNAQAVDTLGFARPAPVFGQETPKKMDVSESVPETPVVTQTEVKEEPQTPAVDVEPAQEMVDVTPEKIKEIVREMYPDMNDDDFDKIVKEYMKVK